MTPPPSIQLSAAEARRVLYLLTLIRAFEERVLKLVSDGSIRGTTHPYVGQEAVAVGACLALRATTGWSARTAATAICSPRAAIRTA